jgi:hypothetical protein
MAVLRSPEEWQQLLAEQALSGLSIRAFCQQGHIALSTFLARKKRVSSHPDVGAPPRMRTKASSPRPKASQTPAFVPLTVRPSLPAAAEITLVWGSSALRLPPTTAPEWVAQLLLTLTGAA